MMAIRYIRNHNGRITANTDDLRRAVKEMDAPMDRTNKRNTGGEVELLPCPWCGEAQSEVRVSEGSTFRWRKVDGCCTDGPEVRHDTMADDQAAAEADSHRRAIEAWNTRANVDRALAESRAEVARLSRALEATTQLWNSGVAEVDRLEARAERLAEALREVRDCLFSSAPNAADRAFTAMDTALSLEPTP